MKAITVVLGGLALAGMVAANAQAVDVVNEDQVPYEIVVQDDNGLRVLEISPGQSLKNICVSCALTIPTDEPLEAQDKDIVLIKDGKMDIKS
ncbi:MAG: hypothetical protein VW709_08865 [Rickettsiales bacterium]